MNMYMCNYPPFSNSCTRLYMYVHLLHVPIMNNFYTVYVHVYQKMFFLLDEFSYMNMYMYVHACTTFTNHE